MNMASIDNISSEANLSRGIYLPDGELDETALFPSLIQALTPRELEVLSWMAHGFSNSAIAERLGIGRRTVENYINRIYQSLQVVDEDDVCTRVLSVLAYIDYIMGSPANNCMVFQGGQKRDANV